MNWDDVTKTILYNIKSKVRNDALVAECIAGREDYLRHLNVSIKLFPPDDRLRLYAFALPLIRSDQWWFLLARISEETNRQCIAFLSTAINNRDALKQDEIYALCKEWNEQRVEEPSPEEIKSAIRCYVTKHNTGFLDNKIGLYLLRQYKVVFRTVSHEMDRYSSQERCILYLLLAMVPEEWGVRQQFIEQKMIEKDEKCGWILDAILEQ